MQVLQSTIAEHSEIVQQLQKQQDVKQSLVQQRAAETAAGLEDRLEAIKKRVEHRLVASKDSLSSIEDRAQSGLHQTHARLERIAIQISELSEKDVLQ